MRLWSLDPALLDRQGLTACWREALLAQAVLLGRTRGYTAHPQLERFREHPDPATAVAAYLHAVRSAATERGYRFDAGRIHLAHEHTLSAARIPVTAGQLDHEWQHLLGKLEARSPGHRASLLAVGTGPAAHPLFVVVPGDVADWERVA